MPLSKSNLRSATESHGDAEPLEITLPSSDRLAVAFIYRAASSLSGSSRDAHIPLQALVAGDLHSMRTRQGTNRVARGDGRSWSTSFRFQATNAQLMRKTLRSPG